MLSCTLLFREAVQGPPPVRLQALTSPKIRSTNEQMRTARPPQIQHDQRRRLRRLLARRRVHPRAVQPHPQKAQRMLTPHASTPNVVACTSDSRTYTAEELEVICPILKIMHHFDLIGMTSVRSIYVSWGEHGYIIKAYDKL